MQPDGEIMRELWEWFKSLMQQLFNPGGNLLKGDVMTSAKLADGVGASAEKEPPPLSDGDYEFLFQQLVAGVSQGWPLERVKIFLEKLGWRGQSDRWLDWLKRYRVRLLATRSPQIELASQIMKIGEMVRSLPQWQSLGEAMYEVGLQLRLRGEGNPLWDSLTPALSPLPVTSESAASPQEPSEPIPDVLAIDQTTPLSAGAANSVEVTPVPQEATPQLWQAPEQVLDSPIMSAAPPAEPIIAAVEETSPPAEPLSEVSSVREESLPPPESDLSVEEYLRQQPVINLAYSAKGRQWTETVNLHQLRQKLQESPNLVVQFSQQVGVNSQDPDEIVQAIYHQLYEIHQSHQQMNAAQMQNADAAAALFNEGLQQAKRGEYAGAIASWNQALSLQPENYKAWLNRGNALVMLHQPQAALESYDKALAIQPGIYDAWGNKGVALLNLGEFEQAIAAFDQAIALKSDYREAWDNRGLALRALGKIEEAIASFDRAIAIDPNDPSPLKHQVETLKLRRQEN